MDAIRVSKVERVICTKYRSFASGSVHLTAHHLIFRYANDNEEEMWVPYPLVSLVTRLPLTLQGNSPLLFHCRTFESFTLSFSKESEAEDVFESVKELTVTTSVTQLYAFSYVPNPPFNSTTGWTLYSPREEFGRMGIGTRTKAWRFSDINRDYSFCPTYPSRLVIPTKISDTTLQYASKYRSKCRIPTLSYLHWSNYATITRSSQPMVGIIQNRSVQDERLIESIFQSHHSPNSRASSVPVYGATATNIIIDARPTTNAVANTAKGAGTENMDHYREARKAYLGIDNIHVMRDSLNKVVEALREADSISASVNETLSASAKGLLFLDRQALRRSGWLRHISVILEGALLIIRNVHINSSHVLVHCSDGWDRTAQLSSLAQMCLDPYYRTTRGFQILIEKDWLSFGHRFLDRCGHLSSEKIFLSATETATNPEASQSFLASVQNRFTSQHHLRETSPVFHQFLECVRQVQRQFPERFEFTERFLRQLHYHLYACQFGTFLFNCERERRVGATGQSYVERTRSVWDFFNSPEEVEKNTNPLYDRSLDNPLNRAPKADMGVLFPNTKDVRFWHELYGRMDEEMNGRITPQAETADVTEPLRMTDIEAIAAGNTSAVESPFLLSQSPSRSTSLPSASSSALLPAQRTVITPTVTDDVPLPFPSSPQSRQMDELPIPALFGSSIGSAPSLFVSSSSSSFFAKKPPEMFSSSGVKSMWGKLSTNASAALSVVQDAYAGVAKDWNQPNSSEREMIPPNAEMLGSEHEPLTAESHDAIPQYTFGQPSNPWANMKLPISAPLSSVYDNPWGSGVTVSPVTQDKRLVDNVLPVLPSDPTVAHVPAQSTRAAPLLGSSTGREGIGGQELDKITLPPISQTSLDPLGVVEISNDSSYNRGKEVGTH